MRDNEKVAADLEAHKSKKAKKAEEAARRAEMKKKMEDGIAKAGETARKVKKAHDDTVDGVKMVADTTVKVGKALHKGGKAVHKGGKAFHALVSQKPKASRGSIVI